MTEIKNLPASIHARLANLAKAQGRPFQEYFYYYIMERFLYRMAQSPYANKIVLKGALIFQGWGLPLRLPTIFHCVRSDNELRAWLISILNQQS